MEVIIISGPPKSGKTKLAVSLTAAISGSTVFGMSHVINDYRLEVQKALEERGVFKFGRAIVIKAGHPDILQHVPTCEQLDEDGIRALIIEEPKPIDPNVLAEICAKIRSWRIKRVAITVCLEPVDEPSPAQREAAARVAASTPPIMSTEEIRLKVEEVVQQYAFEPNNAETWRELSDNLVSMLNKYTLRCKAEAASQWSRLTFRDKVRWFVAYKLFPGIGEALEELKADILALRYQHGVQSSKKAPPWASATPRNEMCVDVTFLAVGSLGAETINASITCEVNA